MTPRGQFWSFWGLRNDETWPLGEAGRARSAEAAPWSAEGERWLGKVLENVQNQIWIFRRKTYDLSSSSAPDHHDAILRALEKNDRAKAAKAMSEHIGNVRQKLVEFLAQSAESVAS